MSQEETIFEGKILKVITKPVNDIPAFEIVQHPGAVAVLAYDDTYVYLTSQQRPAVDAYVIELCAGTREPGEDALDTAKRELAEELGFEADHWKYFGWFYSSPGYTNERVDLYLATGLTDIERPEADDSGLVQIVAWPRIDLDYLLENSHSAKAIIGLQYLLSRTQS